MTFQAADVKLSIDGAAAVNVGASCAETTFGLGWYSWTPASASQTQGQTLILNIADDIGSLWDENALILALGGDSSALYDGT